MRCTKGGFPCQSAWKSRRVLNLGQREDHHVLLAADLVGDHAAADGPSRIGAIQHTAVAAIKKILIRHQFCHVTLLQDYPKANDWPCRIDHALLLDARVSALSVVGAWPNFLGFLAVLSALRTAYLGRPTPSKSTLRIGKPRRQPSP